MPDRPGQFVEGFSRLAEGRYRWAGIYDVTREEDRAFVVMVRRCKAARMLAKNGRRYKVAREYSYVGERDRQRALRLAMSYAKRGRRETV